MQLQYYWISGQSQKDPPGRVNVIIAAANPEEAKELALRWLTGPTVEHATGFLDDVGGKRLLAWSRDQHAER